jgi:hypothetical protein
MRWTNSLMLRLKKLTLWILPSSDSKRSPVQKRSLLALQQPPRGESGSDIYEETSGGITSLAHTAESISNWSGDKSLGKTRSLRMDDPTGNASVLLPTMSANSVRGRYLTAKKSQGYVTASGSPKIKPASRA